MNRKGKRKRVLIVSADRRLNSVSKSSCMMLVIPISSNPSKADRRSSPTQIRDRPPIFSSFVGLGSVSSAMGWQFSSFTSNTPRFIFLERLVFDELGDFGPRGLPPPPFFCVICRFLRASSIQPFSHPSSPSSDDAQDGKRPSPKNTPTKQANTRDFKRTPPARTETRNSQVHPPTLFRMNPILWRVL